MSGDAPSGTDALKRAGGRLDFGRTGTEWRRRGAFGLGGEVGLAQASQVIGRAGEQEAGGGPPEGRPAVVGGLIDGAHNGHKDFDETLDQEQLSRGKHEQIMNIIGGHWQGEFVVRPLGGLPGQARQ